MKIKKDIPQNVVESEQEQLIADSSQNNKKNKSKKIKKTKKRKISFMRKLNTISFNYMIQLLAWTVTVIILLFIGYELFAIKTVQVDVIGFSWTRSLEIESGAIIPNNDWYLPSNGTLQYQQPEVQSYNKIISHFVIKFDNYTKTEIIEYEQLENGESKPVYKETAQTKMVEIPIYRLEPSYATKYYYTVETWKKSDVKTVSGNNQNPYWPQVNLDPNQRESGKTGQYYVHVLYNDKEIKLEVDFNHWNQMKIGSKIDMKTNFFTKKIALGE